MTARKFRLAFIVSHPIQYFAPLYQRLAQRDDISIKVFFTWHAGQAPVVDSGFQVPVVWDIPVTKGYEFELVSNISSDPGTHHFFGLKNPTLVSTVMAWQPDLVHITGWAWLSHLQALRAFSTQGVPTLFRGDSHLLDGGLAGPRWWLKRLVLRRVYSWPTAFLVVGSANRAYYEAFGVTEARMFDCPHSVDVSRFAEPDVVLEAKAAEWRQQLGIPTTACVLLYAGKFERKKRPLELMLAVFKVNNPNLFLLMVGDGELEKEMRALAAQSQRFMVLPFQNQTKMPLVYRLGDVFILPSAYGETWGLAVNEAMACGRPVLVSDRAGCACDLVDISCGWTFDGKDLQSLPHALLEVARSSGALRDMGKAASNRAKSFDILRTEEALIRTVWAVSRA